MKRILEASLVFLVLLALAACASASETGIIMSTSNPADAWRNVKLAWDSYEDPSDIGAPIREYRIFYGEASRYDWWEYKCYNADNIRHTMRVVQSSNLNIRISDDELKLASECPGAYPVHVSAGPDTRLTLTLPKGKRYFAAMRALLSTGDWSDYSDEIEIPAE